MRLLGKNTIQFGELNSSNDKMIRVHTSGLGFASIKFRESDQTWVLINPTGAESELQFAVLATNRVWVSKSGNDTSALLNREDRPFLTFQAAVNAIKANGNGTWDIIGRSGTYDEALNLISPTNQITYNLRLDDGCNILYSGGLGAFQTTVIGGAAGQFGFANLNIYGQGRIENQSGIVGDAVGESDVFNKGFLFVNVYGAKNIQSNRYALTGLLGSIENAKLYGFVNAINLNLPFPASDLLIKNADISSDGNAIHITTGSTLVSIQSSMIKSLSGKGVLCQAVDKVVVEDSEIEAELEAIESIDKYYVWAIRNRLLLSRTSDAIKIGDNINRNDNSQSKIHNNFVICTNTSKKMVQAGAGQNVKATVKFNISNVDVQTGGGAGKITSYGSDNNSINQNITL